MVNLFKQTLLRGFLVIAGHMSRNNENDLTSDPSSDFTKQSMSEPDPTNQNGPPGIISLSVCLITPSGGADSALFEEIIKAQYGRCIKLMTCKLNCLFFISDSYFSENGCWMRVGDDIYVLWNKCYSIVMTWTLMLALIYSCLHQPKKAWYIYLLQTHLLENDWQRYDSQTSTNYYYCEWEIGINALVNPFNLGMPTYLDV